MKKVLMLFAAVCCMVFMGITLNSCDNGNDPSKKTDLSKLDPYLVWGASLADVQAHIEAKDWYKAGNDSLEYWEAMGWHRWYWVADSLTEQYLFKTKDGQNLVYVETYCYATTVSFSEGGQYLTDKGYTLLSSNKDKTTGQRYEYYLSPDKQIRAKLVECDSRYWFILFSPPVNVD